MVEDYQIPWWHRWYKYKYNFVDFHPSKCAGIQKWQIWGIEVYDLDPTQIGWPRWNPLRHASSCARQGRAVSSSHGLVRPLRLNFTGQQHRDEYFKTHKIIEHSIKRSPGKRVGWRKRKEALILIPPAYRDQSPVHQILVVDRSCVKYKSGAQDIICRVKYEPGIMWEWVTPEIPDLHTPGSQLPSDKKFSRQTGK